MSRMRDVQEARHPSLDQNGELRPLSGSEEKSEEEEFPTKNRETGFMCEIGFE